MAYSVRVDGLEGHCTVKVMPNLPDPGGDVGGETGGIVIPAIAAGRV
jgi:hypothetical protein